jgi:hypothetical protein
MPTWQTIPSTPDKIADDIQRRQDELTPPTSCEGHDGKAKRKPDEATDATPIASGRLVAPGGTT